MMTHEVFGIALLNTILPSKRWLTNTYAEWKSQVRKSLVCTRMKLFTKNCLLSLRARFMMREDCHATKVF